MSVGTRDRVEIVKTKRKERRKTFGRSTPKTIPEYKEEREGGG